jgi:steroid delta-isomerase-like uncharacterized protein
MSAKDNTRIAQANYAAYNDRDFERGAALFAGDAELLNVPLGVTLHGREGFRQYVGGWASAFPDSRVEVVNMISSEDGVVTEFRGRGTHTGPLVGPAGEIPATGRSVDLRFCEVMLIKDGKIVSLHTYYDTATMMGQLGLLA